VELLASWRIQAVSPRPTPVLAQKSLNFHIFVVGKMRRRIAFRLPQRLTGYPVQGKIGEELFIRHKDCRRAIFSIFPT
jgi:hypothetical protein